jgi:hypothetical protein
MIQSGVAHSVAHTTPVQEDLGSIPHPDPDGFFGNLPSPFFQTTDLKTDFIHLLYCDVKLK